MKKIILITGGQRSGKSTKAEELALSLSNNPVYLATAHIWDDELTASHFGSLTFSISQILM